MHMHCTNLGLAIFFPQQFLGDGSRQVHIDLLTSFIGWFYRLLQGAYYCNLLSCSPTDGKLVSFQVSSVSGNAVIKLFGTSLWRRDKGTGPGHSVPGTRNPELL